MKEIKEEEMCLNCFDTGEYFNGKTMKICECKASNTIKKSEDGDSSEDDRENFNIKKTKT